MKLKKRLLRQGPVTKLDRENPDWDGQCSVPDIWLLRELVHADKQAALMCCEIHDKEAMKIRGRCRRGNTIVMTVEGAITVPYAAYTKIWRKDVKKANREFFKNLFVGLGFVYATAYYLGVANKLGRSSFTPAKGPLAEREREAKRIAEGLEGYE